jgi:conjugal transfer pilin signal peptidase TrbI
MIVYAWVYKNLFNPRSLFFWIFYFIIIPGSVWFMNQYYSLAFNGTESLDGEVYIVDKTKKESIQRGDVIAFNPPKNRFYNSSFLKIVRGVSGDKIILKNRDFYISECEITCSDPKFLGYAKPKSRNGLPLIPATGGVIQAGNYFVWTSHMDSFDSRYEEISNINTSNVIGVAYKLF